MSTITKARPTVEIDQDIQALVKEDPERFVILHCYIQVIGHIQLRIWPTTYLIEECEVKSMLLHAFNISYPPDWTSHFLFHGEFRFTLIFEGLPPDCKSFYMEELCVTDGQRFYTEQIKRNATDVYHVRIHSK